MHIREMQEKIQKMSFVFLGNGASSYYVKITMLRREYMLSVVNVLTNSVKIPDTTIEDFVQLNLPQIHEKIG